MAEKVEKQDNYVRQTGSLMERLRRVKTTRWWRFGIVAAIYVAWTVWMKNPWLLLGLLLLGDIYLTQFIPWGAWKGWKSGWARTLMSWVDAIVYALVLVYFLFAFVGQNYQIPSSSLEKTLLTGDYLWVNKLVYGPRVPQTPLHFPLAQNTLFGCKSYIEKPQIAYHRLKGMRNVRRGDIVVFNYPNGDTVAVNCPNPDYYTLCQEYGKEAILNNPDKFGEVVWRPVDRRDAYVKRCVGLPGETFEMKDGVIYIDGKQLPQPKNMQFNYFVQTTQLISDELFEELGIAVDDRNIVAADTYHLPLTDAMKQQLEASGIVAQIMRTPDNPKESLYTYPIGTDYGWTHNNYGPLLIPKKGMSINLTVESLPLYERCIRTYEGNTLEVRNGEIVINGTPATSYTFKMDYYWMMGDNRDNSSDSRFWGFVPEDHIVGTPMIILISFDKDKGLLSGGIRWKRMFRSANPDEFPQ